MHENINTVVYGPKDLNIQVFKGTRNEVEGMRPPVPDGWVRLGIKIEPDGRGKGIFLAVFVDQEMVNPEKEIRNLI